MIGLTVAFGAVSPVDSASAETDILGIEAARFGAGSDFGLGGTVGDLGLLSDPVMDLKRGQYDLNFSVIEGCRPLSVDKGADVVPATSSLNSSLLSGDDSLDTAGVACSGSCGDVIRPPVFVDECADVVPATSSSNSSLLPGDDSLDTAGGRGDVIRPPVVPPDGNLLASGFSRDAGDPDFGGAFNSSAVNCWIALTCPSRS